MTLLVKQFNEEATGCNCGCNHDPVLMHCVIEPNAYQEIPSYLNEQGIQKFLLVMDENTRRVAGDQLHTYLNQEGFASTQCILTPNEIGDVVADERTIVQLLLAVSESTQAILAVGSGTIHDIVRFVTHKMSKRFISVPTAASVDGYASAGAPIIVHGVKQTFQAIAPEAIFADLTVLAKAPRSMTAAGFADMMGKFTSLADWTFSSRIAGEPFCPFAYKMTKQALTECIDHIQEIAEGTETGTRLLFEALTRSGWSMLAIGHSRPASGGEHHLSHHWEMAYLEQKRPQLLHGAKVGVASVLIAGIYRNLWLSGQCEEAEVYCDLPEPSQMAEWLMQVGGPAYPADVGISQQMVDEALNQAYKLRVRHTGLWFMNSNKVIMQPGSI